MTATTTQTSYVYCDPETISRGIFAEVDGQAQEVLCMGTYGHPEHKGQADWDITLYRVTFDGWKTHVASTNGDPVWQETDEQAFADMLTEYGALML